MDDGPPSIVHRPSSHAGTPMLVALLATVGSVAAHGGQPLSTTLTGSAEIAGGDPDGSGSASITLNHGRGEICFELSVSGIAPAGVNGPVVVRLTPPASGCTSADPNLIKAIIQHPENYYVNIHFEAEAEGQDQPFIVDGRNTFILHRPSGAWKVIHYHGSPPGPY